jgi:glycosyltransferase involved in cell wall biosynthesis
VSTRPEPELAASRERARPRFSIVTAVHDVHRYLPDFIDAIEQQTYPIDRVEVIAVDDGSGDDSPAILQEWAARRPELVRVFTKENGGQGSARNLGLDHARGEWLTFPDPDDVLDPEYLSIVDGFLTDNPSAVMAATARIMWQEDTGTIRDNHPLRQMFEGPDQLVDLNRFPEFFHGSASAAFIRADIVAGERLRFDTEIRPNFEDGHFCSRYLLATNTPLVGFLGTAHYIYRKRGDRTSTLQTGLLDPKRFVVVPRHGYLDLLTHGVRPGQYAPEWIQNLVLYELSYYFASDLRMSGGTAARGDVAEQFIGLLREIASKLDPAVVQAFNVSRLDPVWRDILLHGLGGERWVTPYAVLDKRDPRQQLVRLSYRYTGTAPKEQILFQGGPVEIRYGKTWTHRYFEHDLMHERVAWVPANGTLRVFLDGRQVRLQPDWGEAAVYVVRPAQLQRWENPWRRKPKLPALRRPTKAVRWLARTWPVRRRFGGAWALMDRIHDADDNGERLFRYLRDNRPDLNAWFILERGTPDWDRLRRDGYGRRMIPHGGVLWRLLMLNCAHLISSHADAPVHRPPAIMRMKPVPQWSFTFLQHGVIKDDLSSWLNPKDVDLFVTSTPQEQQSIAGDGTPYRYTSREARMTGLPRFDRLLELGARVGVDRRRYLLVCPTWRHWLTPPLPQGSQRREVTDDFFDSEYVQQWTAFLSDERLRKVAADTELRIGFLPHPNIQPALAKMTLPTDVEALSFAGQDVQQLIAEAALMVTDYSSMAFNAAYLDRPVVYFQFDAERMGEGAHVGRRGYFDYSDDGFGPVTHSVERAVDEIVSIVTTGGKRVAPCYQRRIDATFTERDGRCCERTTAAIEDFSPYEVRPSLAYRVLRRLAQAYARRHPVQNRRFGAAH